MTEGKGKCRHGEFDLKDGCPQCIADRMAVEGNTPEMLKEAIAKVQPAIVKVQYYSETTGELSSRPYSYYSEDRLEVGDIVSVPVRGTTTKARVCAVDVPASEIEAFRDHVKTIPPGSIMPQPAITEGKPGGDWKEIKPLGPLTDTRTAEEKAADNIQGRLVCDEKASAEAGTLVADLVTNEGELDRMVNLCDTCTLRMDYPVCSPSDVEFGDGQGNDNIIKCSKHEYGPPAPSTVPLNVEIQPEAEPAAEKAVALRPGEDLEAHGYFEESMRLLKYAEGRVIATVEQNKQANDDLSAISRLKKAMDGKRKEYLEPLKAQTEAIRGTYDYLMAPVLEADKITRNKMLAFDAEQRRVRAEQEEINRLREEAAQKQKELTGEITEVEIVEVAPEPAKRVTTDMGTSGMTDHWKYEIVDFAALSDEYKVEDSSMLNAVARKHHDRKPVPGVRFYCEKIITMRPR